MVKLQYPRSNRDCTADQSIFAKVREFSFSRKSSPKSGLGRSTSNFLSQMVLVGSLSTIYSYFSLLLSPAVQKNRILAKNRRYAKMRENENSRTLAKIEWTTVQSLLLLGYCNFTKNCSRTCFIGNPKDFFIFLL